MRLLDRYLLRELLTPFAVCLVGFSILWLAIGVYNELDDLLALHVPALSIAAYFIIKLPELFPLGLPLSLLLGLLYTLTNHSRHHEITAIRAAGVSLWRLALPYFFVGAACSVVLLIASELWIPDITERGNQIKASRAESDEKAKEKRFEKNFGFRNSRDGRSWQALTYDRQTSEMTNLNVTWTLPDGSHRWIIAERALHTNGAWLFVNARLYRDAGNTNTAPVPILQTNALWMTQFAETPQQINSQLKVARRMSLKNARTADIPLMELIDYLRFNPKLPKADRAVINTKLQGRLAAPWMCLVVVLISLPFGVATGRKNIFAGVAGSVFICFAYIFLRELGLAMGSGGYVTPWLAAWLPNFIFAATGTWLIKRAH
jgi:lipopolysaccharide export system permease protein